MERNWLIRTSQNQILGPVAKQKLLEFVQKGALHLTDEVSSGNGYWFALKEKDLVEKYLFGDVPQSYNPISESQTVLARRENPNKTTSINSSPANQVHKSENATQVLKREDIKIPTSEDLSYPDLVAPTTTNKVVEPVSKVPSSADLEFPDVNEVALKVQASFEKESLSLNSPSVSFNEIKQDEITLDEDLTFVVSLDTLGENKVAATEEVAQAAIIYPNNDDLEFPDIDEPIPQYDKAKIDLSKHHTQSVAIGVEQRDEILAVDKQKHIDKNNLTFDEDEESNDLIVSVTLDVEEKTEVTKVEELAPVTAPIKVPKIDPRNSQGREEKFLLHDRKQKNSKLSGAALRDPNREVAHKIRDEKGTGGTKKRSDNYLFFILILLVLIIVAVFYYFKEILNKPFPV